MTTGSHAYATRIPCTFQRKQGVVVIDQLRAIDRDRIVRVLGTLPPATQQAVLQALAAYFAP
jgi:mRNA interferase MazF